MTTWELLWKPMRGDQAKVSFLPLAGHFPIGFWSARSWCIGRACVSNTVVSFCGQSIYGCINALAGSMGNELCSLDEALQGANAASWDAALKYEISQIEKLHTWKIIDQPSNKPIMPCSAVLKEKMNANDEIVSHHIWIIASSHKQTYGIDYTETFLCAVKMSLFSSWLCILTGNYIRWI